MKKFKVGDQVLVTAGKDKGRTGEISRILTKKDRVVVKGINLYKRHRKATQNSEGGIISLERPLPTASIALIEGGKPIRVGLKRDKTGLKRVSKKTGKVI